MGDALATGEPSMFGRDGDMGENTEAESGSREVFASISQRVTGGKGVMGYVIWLLFG
jgi:hypothetical protein